MFKKTADLVAVGSPNEHQNYEEMRVFVVITMVVIKMMIVMIMVMIMMMVKMMMTCGQHCAHVRCRHFHTWMIILMMMNMMNMMNMMILTVMMTVTMSPNLLAHWNLF